MAKQHSEVSEGGFKRDIGLGGAISVISGIVVGSGIFYLGSYVLQYVGMSQGYALLCWMLAGALSMIGGLCVAELGANFPRAGGNVYYLSEAFHPILGSLQGYTLFLVADPASSAAIAMALVTAVIGNQLGEWTVKGLAIAIIIALCWYNCFGVKLSNILQSVSNGAKLIPLMIIIVVGFWRGTVTPDLSFAIKVPTDNNLNVISMIALGVIASLWAYEGWSNIIIVSEEVHHPKKNIPLAVVLSLSGITLLYTLFNYVIFRVLPASTISGQIEKGNLYLGTLVSETLMGHMGSTLVIICMALAMFGSLNGCLWTPPRTYYAMAQEDHWFKIFGKLDPKTRVPVWGFIIEAIVACIFVIFNTLQDLTILVAFTSLIYNSLGVVAVLVFRRKYPKADRSYKVWTPLIAVYLLAEIVLIVYTVVSDTRNSLIALAAQLIGIAIYFGFEMYNRQHPDRLKKNVSD